MAEYKLKVVEESEKLVIILKWGSIMNNLSLTACSIWIREKNFNKNNSIKIINLNKKIIGKEKEYNDFFDVLKNFCEKYSRKFVLNNYEQKMFKIETQNVKVEENDKFRYTYIDINSGGYGIEANIVNTKTNKVLYTRKREHAETIHFRVFFAVPKGNDTCKGIIIFQNIGQYGIKTITTDYLRKFINDELNLYTTTGNICPQVFVKKLLDNNGLMKIIYIRNNISNDKADIETMGYGKEERIITGFSNMKKWKEKISEYFNGSNRIYEFEDIDYSGVKFVTSIYGRIRTININNINKLSIIEGIPDEVINSLGNIDEQRLKNHFVEVTKEYLEHMVYNKI